MKGYGQFCPIAVACETLTERWTPLVVRELLAGSRRFNDLRRGLPLMSPTLLSKRLKTLERVGIIERIDDAETRSVEYRLTAAGHAIQPIVNELAVWGMTWGGDGLLDPANLDAALLMWDIRRNVVVDHVPHDRVVAEFHLTGSTSNKSRYWLVLDDGEADLCLTDPGFDVDLYVDCHVSVMIRYWLGMTEIPEAVRAGDLRLTGSRALVRAFPTWFRRSSLAEGVRV
jgi:DNA-binding HxlR family transcriptional regulator